MWQFILGAVLGVTAATAYAYFKQGKETDEHALNQSLQHKLDDRLKAMQAMLNLMIQSASSNRDSVKTTVGNMINQSSTVAQSSADVLTDIAATLTNSHERLIEVTEKMSELLSQSNSGMDISNSLMAVNEDFKVSAEQLASVEHQINAINEKAAQINAIGQDAEMLALNAAIEAARAGEAGRGFAVVADSMKSLAKSSQSIATEVRQKLAASQQTITQVSDAIGAKSSTLIKTSDELINAFQTLNTVIEVATQRTQNLDEEFTKTKHFVDQQTETTRSQMEESIRNLTLQANKASGLTIVDLTPQKAKQQLASFDYLIDVRRSDEFNDELGHIDGAKLITLQTDFPQEVKKLPKDKRYLFICRSGGRSTKAAQQALFEGIEKVYNLDGGMIAWRKAGL